MPGFGAAAAAAMAESEAVMKVEDTSAASKATEPTPSKKDGDAETENIEELEMKGLKIVENVDDIVDEPGHIKSEELIEPETIKKVVADDTPYTSARAR